MNRIALSWLLVFAIAPIAAGDPLATCEERFREYPEDYESSYCFYQAAQPERRWTEAKTRLQAAIASEPENHWPLLVLAHVYWRLDPGRAEATYRAAANGFKRQDHALGEVLARTNLYGFLISRGELDRTDNEVDRVVEIAATAEDPGVRARALILEADHLRDQGLDLETAYRLLRRAESLIADDGPYRLRRTCLIGLGTACFRLGRYDEAGKYYRQLETLTRQAGDDYARALAIYNQANTSLAEAFELPTAGSRDRLLSMYREALAAAVAAGHQSAEIQSHRVLGELMSRSPERRSQAQAHLERCADLAVKRRQAGRLAACRRALGGHLAFWGEDAAATEQFTASLAHYREQQDIEGVARVMEKRLRARWNAGSREQALADTGAALNAVETLRDQQMAASGRAGLFAAWSDHYYWPAGRLLGADEAPRSPSPESSPLRSASTSTSPSRSDLELAFSLAERLRARVLLEAVASSGADGSAQEPSRIEPPRADLVRVQRRLLRPGLAGVERRRTLRELERLEMREAEASYERFIGSKKLTTEADFASLAEIEAALGENEAFLSFQVALWQDVYGDFGGGSWLLASTRLGTRVYRLPDRVALWPSIRLFQGLFEDREGSEVGPAAALGEDLLASALADLPPGVDRLVIVPDGDLHLLPFAALRTARDAPPIASRFQISRVPSATLWLHWRRKAEGRSTVQMSRRAAVLALADPLPAGAEAVGPREQPSQDRTWALVDGTRLGALPHARAEGRAVVRHLGSGSRLLIGAEATEHYLKHAQLTPYGVLHFAAHAVIDSSHRQRSAVVLAPGAPSEDGLLQPRDIASLDLDGKVVVLSVCQSATGSILRGEGVLSLARAFFQAGASAVVGSLWRLRDDEAAALFDRFYRHLAAGKSVAAALAAAQGDRIRDGAPAAAWAGLTILGDGAVVPVPGGRLLIWQRTFPWVLVAIVLLGLVTIGWRKFQRR